MRKDKTAEQIRKDIRASIKKDSQIGLWDAFWSHILFISTE